jgi:adenosylcobinamide-GDP ribazoletransferase
MKIDNEMDRVLIYLKDLSLCLARLTVLPAPRGSAVDRPQARSVWAYPVIGAFLGAIGGLVYAVMLGLGLTALLAAILAVASLLCLTGAKPERAFAELVDLVAELIGRSGPTDYETSGGMGIAGVLTIVLSLGARIGALAAIGEAVGVAAALVAAMALSLAVVVTVSYCIPSDLDEEFSESSNRPGTGEALASGLLAAVLSALVLPAGAAAAILGACLCGALLSYAVWRQLDLDSGKLVAAAQPITEITVLVILAASVT